MSDPAPTPTPRNRKARRNLSPGQVAYLQGKAVRDKAKADRESERKRDAYYLNKYHPEIAKAKRSKGVENNKEASAWRRHAFVESFADWPSVLTPGEMGCRLREWLRERSFLNPKTGRRRWKWRGCEKNFTKTEVSVRKKLTELRVFRYNFKLGVWIKAGSVEEAQEAERVQRLAREEHEKREREMWRAIRQREEADRDRLSRPAVTGWHDFIPEALKPTALAYFHRNRRLAKEKGLDDLSVSEAEMFAGKDRGDLLFWLQSLHDSSLRQVAEAVLVAD